MLRATWAALWGAADRLMITVCPALDEEATDCRRKLNVKSDTHSPKVIGGFFPRGRRVFAALCVQYWRVELFKVKSLNGLIH